jgi:hypothetical protein
LPKGTHPNSLKALSKTQRKKGEGPLPGAGRPKGALSLKERLLRFLDIQISGCSMPDGSIQDKTVLEQIILTLISRAIAGDIHAIKEVFDRGFGKETDKLEIEDGELKSSVDVLKNAIDLLKKHERDY